MCPRINRAHDFIIIPFEVFVVFRRICLHQYERAIFGAVFPLGAFYGCCCRYIKVTVSAHIELDKRMASQKITHLSFNFILQAIRLLYSSMTYERDSIYPHATSQKTKSAPRGTHRKSETPSMLLHTLNHHNGYEEKGKHLLPRLFPIMVKNIKSM